MGPILLSSAGGAYALMIVCAVRQAKRDMARRIVRRNEQRRHF